MYIFSGTDTQPLVVSEKMTIMINSKNTPSIERGLRELTIKGQGIFEIDNETNKKILEIEQ